MNQFSSMLVEINVPNFAKDTVQRKRSNCVYVIVSICYNPERFRKIITSIVWIVIIGIDLATKY